MNECKSQDQMPALVFNVLILLPFFSSNEKKSKLLDNKFRQSSAKQTQRKHHSKLFHHCWIRPYPADPR